MRVTRLFFSGSLKCDTQVQLENHSSNHLVRVLRTKLGSKVTLFNGDGFDYHCTTVDEHPRKTCIQIETKECVSNESNLQIHLLQGICKSHRMEFCIQKAVELGVREITPVFCKRSQNKLAPNKQDDKKLQKKLQHWQQVAISACEQSGRAIIPKVNPPITLDDYLEINNNECLNIFLEPTAEHSLQSSVISEKYNEHQKVSLLIGPEGGISGEEIGLLKGKDWQGVRLGPRVLRTETAGLAAISAIQVLWGDF